METVTIKLQKETAEKINSLVKKFDYGTKTEFIREAIRAKIEALRKEQAWHAFFALRGKAKKHVSDEELRKTREEVGREYAARFGIKID